MTGYILLLFCVGMLFISVKTRREEARRQAERLRLLEVEKQKQAADDALVKQNQLLAGYVEVEASEQRYYERLRLLEIEKQKQAAGDAPAEQNQRLAEEAEERPGEQDMLANVRVVARDLKELQRNRRRLLVTGDYGLKDTAAWQSHLQNYVLKKLECFDDSEVGEWVWLIEGQLAGLHLEGTEVEVGSVHLENLSPAEFESACAESLERSGWATRLTKSTGDQGIDIIASKPKKQVAVQCKLYSKPVGNKAVQEALAGKSFIEAEFACVVSNSKFTRSAKELASTTGVILLHFEELHKLDALTSS